MTNDFDELSLENKLDVIKEALNRPIRICGMVKMKGARRRPFGCGTKVVAFHCK
jgi:hypothetical protein